MITIQDLFHRIRWDARYDGEEFEVGYYDRVEERIVRVPFRRLRIGKGEEYFFEVAGDEGAVHGVPLHRVREVWRNGELIWHRARHA